MKIEKGRRVTIKFELSAGTEMIEKRTVEYIQGGGTMLPALEAALTGLEKGAKKDGTIKAKDAFGNPASFPLKKMKRSEFPKTMELKIGEKLVARGEGDKMNVILKIEKIDGDNVDVRLVHPLAEKDITYKVEVVNVTDPRPPPMPAAAMDLEPDPEK